MDIPAPIGACDPNYCTSQVNSKVVDHPRNCFHGKQPLLDHCNEPDHHLHFCKLSKNDIPKVPDDEFDPKFCRVCSLQVECDYNKISASQIHPFCFFFQFNKQKCRPVCDDFL
eukprot:Lithocolla_globosa_v1_NODE_586_length_3676_cov_4.989506.p4 type:complete len:113 gc:universal NODE_586_length_3676_cov_4.989506:2157-2495(+)